MTASQACKCCVHRYCVKTAAALQGAFGQVEAAKVQDHAKQAALQRTLTSIRTLQPVSHCLAVSKLLGWRLTLFKTVSQPNTLSLMVVESSRTSEHIAMRERPQA